MSLRYFDVLEETLKQLDEWRASRLTTKDDVLDSMRERILMIMTHVLVTPLIGTAYAYPGDMKTLEEWSSDSVIPTEAV